MNKEAESVGAQVDLVGEPDFCGCVNKEIMHVSTTHAQILADKHDGRAEHTRAQQSHKDMMCTTRKTFVLLQE